MPFLNGRHYANRIFGRAAELGRIFARHRPSLSHHHAGYNEDLARPGTHSAVRDALLRNDLHHQHHEPEFDDLVYHPHHNAHGPRFSDEVYRPGYYHQHNEPEFITEIGRPGDSKIVPLPLGRETHELAAREVEFPASQPQTQQPPQHHPADGRQQIPSQHPAPQHTYPAQKPPQTTRHPEPATQNANRVYNESSGLRPTTKAGSHGTETDLHNARIAMSHVIRNRQSLGDLKGVAPNMLTHSESQAVQQYPPARSAYQDALNAAHKAAAEPDPTRGATHFYLDYGQPAPSWARGKQPVASYGPFSNPAGGGDVHTDSKRVMIRIYY